jgi:hypothetical protein
LKHGPGKADVATANFLEPDLGVSPTSALCAFPVSDAERPASERRVIQVAIPIAALKGLKSVRLGLQMLPDLAKSYIAE